MPSKKETNPPNLEIRWKMFHGFKDTGWLEIRPLTILIGANGTGKSSLVAPLIVLKQTLNSPVGSPALVGKGKLINIGRFTDVAFHHNPSAKLFFGLRFHTHEPTRRLASLGTYPPGAIEIEFARGESQDFVLKSYQVFDLYKRLYMKRNRSVSGNYSIIGNLFTRLRPYEREALLKSHPINFMFNPSKALSDVMSLRRQAHKSLDVKPSDHFNHYLNVVGYVYDEIESILRNLAYIGPIREKPRRYYESSGDVPNTVGEAGERAPQLFRQHYPKLRKEVDKWARAFGLASNIRYKDISHDLFEVQLVSNKPKLATNISDSGFGVSQLFPLIIQAVTANKGSVTIAEQPEIHLNPRCQSMLADLFVELATNGKRAIVETHSEHLLLRLRRLVAEKKIKPSQVAIYFVEKQNGETRVKKVPIADNGHIESSDWPRGFFEDALKESLALAAAQG